jgi:HTH-type transcriptional regulator/antitoxin HigA
MSMRTYVARVNDDYLDLVRRFPLRAIRNERDHAAAGRMLNRLLGRRQPPLSHGEGQYLDALIELSKAYESQAHLFTFEKMQPIEIVRYLMEQNDMNTADLGKILGNKTAASLVLSGKRELSKGHIRKLAARFKVEPGLFL